MAHLTPHLPPENPQTDAAAPEGVVHRHKTAIARRTLSAPMQALWRNGFLNGNQTVFDYGCGQGDDMRALEEAGVPVGAWDPHFRPEASREPSEVVNLGFVINVIEDPAERRQALLGAFSLTTHVLSVATLIGGRAAHERFRAFGDGVLTSIGTFQKYYTQEEFEGYVAEVLGREPVTIAPGIVFVFKTDEQEQDFLLLRQRRRFHARRSMPRAERPDRPAREPRAPRPQHIPRWVTHEELMEDFWSTCLDLGRTPEPGEYPREPELREKLGTPKRVLTHLLKTYGPEPLEEARAERMGDTYVYLALGCFARRASFGTLSPRIRRDIKAFWGSYKAAVEEAQRLLFSIADTKVIHEACIQAAAKGIGHLDGDHSLMLHSSLAAELPAVLRIYLGCATKLYGDVEGADLIKLHIQSGKVTLLLYDDFERLEVPNLIERVKINLRQQKIDFFEYRGSLSVDSCFKWGDLPVFVLEHGATVFIYARRCALDYKMEKVKKYIGLKAPGYALALTGEWGSGKTFFAKQVMDELSEENPKYISCYGLSSTSQINDLLFALHHPVLASKPAFVISQVLSGVMKGAFRFDLNGDDKDDITADVSAANKGLASKSFLDNFKDGDIIVFDDVERSSIPLGELFGYINSFTEHSGCRVLVLINNREVLLRDPKAKDNLEKLIGVWVAVHPDVKSAVGSFVDGLDFIDDDLGKYIQNIVRASFVDDGVKHNLRYVRQALQDLNSALAEFSKLSLSEERMRSVYHTAALVLVSTSLEVQGDFLSKNDVQKFQSYLLSGQVGLLFGKETAPGKRALRYVNLQLFDLLLPDWAYLKLYEESVFSGDDVDSIIFYIDSKRHNLPLEKLAWFWDLEDGDYMEACSCLFHYLDLVEFVSFEHLAQCIGVYFKLKDAGLVDVCIQDTKEIADKVWKDSPEYFLSCKSDWINFVNAQAYKANPASPERVFWKELKEVGIKLHDQNRKNSALFELIKNGLKGQSIIRCIDQSKLDKPELIEDLVAQGAEDVALQLALTPNSLIASFAGYLNYSKASVFGDKIDQFYDFFVGLMVRLEENIKGIERHKHPIRVKNLDYLVGEVSCWCPGVVQPLVSEVGTNAPEDQSHEPGRQIETSRGEGVSEA